MFICVILHIMLNYFTNLGSDVNFYNCNHFEYNYINIYMISKEKRI